MTKADIAEKVYEKLSCTKDEAFDLVESTLEVLKEAIAKEGHVKISGFGNFVVKRKAARKGRNPQTGEEITITPRKIISIQAKRCFKEQGQSRDNPALYKMPDSFMISIPRK